jgi:Ni,Fe-hydrogenase maturation factor
MDAKDNLLGQLTTYERDVLFDVVKKGLETKVGESRAISSTEIINTLKAKGYQIKGPNLRNVIKVLRQSGELPIVTNKYGYYIAASPDEVDKQVESLRLRADAIYESSDGLELAKKRFFGT